MYFPLSTLDLPIRVCVRSLKVFFLAMLAYGPAQGALQATEAVHYTERTVWVGEGESRFECSLEASDNTTAQEVIESVAPALVPQILEFIREGETHLACVKQYFKFLATPSQPTPAHKLFFVLIPNDLDDLVGSATPRPCLTLGTTRRFMVDLHDATLVEVGLSHPQDVADALPAKVYLAAYIS